MQGCIKMGPNGQSLLFLSRFRFRFCICVLLSETICNPGLRERHWEEMGAVSEILISVIIMIIVLVVDVVVIITNF